MQSLFVSGDWFVLYQMSKNVNKRFFAEFLALLALTVDPGLITHTKHRALSLLEGLISM